MRLAAIVGICLLTSCALGSSAPLVLQATESQDSHLGYSTSQSSAGQSPSNQQKTSSNPAATAIAPCPENSQSTSTAKSDCKPPTKTRKHRKSIAPPTSAQAGPPKTVVPNGGTDDPTVNLSPGVTPQQASREVDSTNKLLATSDANLKKVSGHPLNSSQQDTVKQIKSYMEQAKTAASDGDLQRAYNLAVKANLLSAELAGH